jgi:hypothetical protein
MIYRNVLNFSALSTRCALVQNACTEFVKRCCVRYRLRKVFKKIVDRDTKMF